MKNENIDNWFEDYSMSVDYVISMSEKREYHGVKAEFFWWSMLSVGMRNKGIS